MSEEELKKVWLMRRALDLMGEGQDPTEAVLERMRRSKTNQEFLDSLGKEGTLRSFPVSGVQLKSLSFGRRFSVAFGGGRGLIVIL